MKKFLLVEFTIIEGEHEYGDRLWTVVSKVVYEDDRALANVIKNILLNCYANEPDALERESDEDLYPKLDLFDHIIKVRGVALYDTKEKLAQALLRSTRSFQSKDETEVT